jgi:drug/metabolite transporter (DMT)-like permease
VPPESSARRGVLLGLAAAVSFGISAPLAKVLLDDVRPQLLAGLLYLGAFGALSAGRRSRTEAPLRRADLPRPGAMIFTGGVLAPVLLLLGLDRVTGVAGSLLLNLEGPFTIVVGVALYREHLPRREAAVFAVAPFAGALLAPLVLPETFGAKELAAGAAMGLGVSLLLRERHEHRHRHQPLDHEHVHVHDEHHEHRHTDDASAGVPHSHAHHHDDLVHGHAHVSDVHHRHGHPG